MRAFLSDDLLRSLSSPQVFARGQGLYGTGALFDLQRQANLLQGKCEGSITPFYHLRVELDESGLRSAGCSCPYDGGGLCKHLVALLLVFIHHPEEFAERKSVAELVQGLDQEGLVHLLDKLLTDDPDMYERLERAVALMQASRDKGRALGKKGKTASVEGIYRRQVRSILHSLDGYRMSEAYWMMVGMVQQLRHVQVEAEEFLEAGEVEEALAVLLILLEEVAGSFEQFDDSDGELGAFLGELGRPLAEAILSAGLEDEERQVLQEHLAPLVDELEQYGIEGTEVALAALEEGWKAGGFDDEEDWQDGGGDLIVARLNVLERQGRLEEYLALCQEAGEQRRYALKLLEIGHVEQAVADALNNLVYADDALLVAQQLHEMGEIRNSLAIGERGLNLGGSKQMLGTWLGSLEEVQGRLEQARSAYQATFYEHPSLELYLALQRLAGPGWGSFKPELIAAMQRLASKDVLAEVYLYEEDWDAAAVLADGADWDYRLVEKVVEGVLPHRPEWAIRACLKQSDRLIERTQSQYYPIAVDWLERVKKGYSIQGKRAEWQDYLADLKARYARRPALQKQLRKL